MKLLQRLTSSIIILQLIRFTRCAPEIRKIQSSSDLMNNLLRIGSEGLKDIRILDLPSLFSFGKTTLPPDKQSHSIGTDDLFSELSMFWNDEDNSLTETSSVPTTTTVKSKISGKPVWERLKIILGNMKSALQDMNGEDAEGFEPLLQTIDQMLEFGDKINLIEVIKDSFDPGLLNFLELKWNDTKNRFVHKYPLVETFLNSNSTFKLPKKFIFLAIQKLSDILHEQAFMHVGESSFVINLMRTSGFTDDEIKEVFHLLQMPYNAPDRDFNFDDLKETENDFSINNENPDFSSYGNELVEGRQFSSRDYYDYGKDAGYGGGGGHSGGGGYGGGNVGYGNSGYSMMSNFDPLVLLAGLAFATFAAYIIYRLLSSTTGKRRKRSSTDFDQLALDLSDIPTVLDNLYNWIGKSEAKYGNNEESILDADTLSYQANELWANFNADRLTKSCLKKYICEIEEKNAHRILTSSSTFAALSMASLATIFGMDEAPKYLDTLVNKAMEGEKMQCQKSTCEQLTHYKKYI